MQHWQDSIFVKHSLQSLGLCIQLGHWFGFDCLSWKMKKLTVFHTNGIHQLDVYFCDCQFDAARRVQLLRQAWYPATPLEPETCATFELL